MIRLSGGLSSFLELGMVVRSKRIEREVHGKRYDRGTTEWRGERSNIDGVTVSSYQGLYLLLTCPFLFTIIKIPL